MLFFKFRIDAVSFPINRFLEIFPDTKKLSRLLIKFKMFDKLDYEKLKTFLDRNPQLNFFYVAIELMTKNDLKVCKKLLNTYMKKDCSRYYYVDQKITNFKEHPSIHLCDMIYYKSKIGYMDIFSEF